RTRGRPGGCSVPSSPGAPAPAAVASGKSSPRPSRFLPTAKPGTPAQVLAVGCRVPAYTLGFRGRRHIDWKIQPRELMLAAKEREETPDELVRPGQRTTLCHNETTPCHAEMASSVVDRGRKSASG